MMYAQGRSHIYESLAAQPSLSVMSPGVAGVAAGGRNRLRLSFETRNERWALVRDRMPHLRELSGGIACTASKRASCYH